MNYCHRDYGHQPPELWPAILWQPPGLQAKAPPGLRAKASRDYVREIREAFRELVLFVVFLILHGRGRKNTVSGNSSGNSFAKLREIGRGMRQEYFSVVRIFFGNNKKHVSVGSSSQEFDANKFTPEARESWRRTEWPKAYVTLDPHRL